MESELPPAPGRTPRTNLPGTAGRGARPLHFTGVDRNRSPQRCTEPPQASPAPSVSPKDSGSPVPRASQGGEIRFTEEKGRASGRNSTGNRVAGRRLVVGTWQVTRAGVGSASEGPGHQGVGPGDRCTGLAERVEPWLSHSSRHSGVLPGTPGLVLRNQSRMVGFGPVLSVQLSASLSVHPICLAIIHPV